MRQGVLKLSSTIRIEKLMFALQMNMYVVILKVRYMEKLTGRTWIKKSIKVILASMLFLQNVLAQDTAEIQNTSILRNQSSPYSTLKSINVTDVTWTNGFWHDYVTLVRNTTIPFLYEIMNNANQGKSVHNMQIAAGIEKGEYKGNHWQDAWIYKWIEMAVVTYAITRDDQLLNRTNELVSLIARAQQSDGYISTNIQVTGGDRFKDPKQHEWYNMGHLMTASALHHRMTGQTDFLSVGVKVCDFGYMMFKDHGADMAHFPINPSMVMGALEMYRETGDRKFQELARMVIDNRGKYPGGSDNWQDRIPLSEETEVIGHAVWYTYLYAGAADLFMETGNNTLMTALERLWEDLVEHKLYIHGGTSASYRNYGIRKDGDIWKAMEVYESAGLPYQQPNAFGYNETCGQVGNFMWNYRMLMISGDPRYAEIMENEMFNGFLGSMGQDGKSFFYVNPLRWHGKEQLLLSSSSLHRGVPGSENIGTCCPTNFSRTMVELQSMIYSKSEEGLWVHHYGSNQFDDGEWSLEQTTDYPWEGLIELVIRNMPENKALFVRIPEWADNAKISVNDHTDYKPGPSTYFKIEGLGSGANRIVIDFPMKARLMSGNPKIEETLNQVAVKRGPLLFALEEIDLPEVVQISEVVIPSDIKLNIVWDESGLNNYPRLTGTAKYFEQSDWAHKMYQDFRMPSFNSFEIVMIPYFLWANRGISKMSVWLPIDY